MKKSNKVTHYQVLTRVGVLLGVMIFVLIGFIVEALL